MNKRINLKNPKFLSIPIEYSWEIIELNNKYKYKENISFTEKCLIKPISLS